MHADFLLSFATNAIRFKHNEYCQSAALCQMNEYKFQHEESNSRELNRFTFGCCVEKVPLLSHQRFFLCAFISQDLKKITSVWTFSPLLLLSAFLPSVIYQPFSAVLWHPASNLHLCPLFPVKATDLFILTQVKTDNKLFSLALRLCTVNCFILSASYTHLLYVPWLHPWVIRWKANDLNSSVSWSICK